MPAEAHLKAPLVAVFLFSSSPQMVNSISLAAFTLRRKHTYFDSTLAQSVSFHSQ